MSMTDETTPQPLTPADLRQFIAQSAISAHLIEALADTPTVPAAAAALGVESDQIIKTLLFVIELPGQTTCLPAPIAKTKLQGGNVAELHGGNPVTLQHCHPATLLSSEQRTAQPVVVISNGERRVDKKLLADHFGVSKKRVTLAPAAVVLDLLGYPAGGVPPFGHRTRLPVLLDAAIGDVQARFDGVIYGGGGDDRTMMKLNVDELLRITDPVLVALSGA